MTELVTSKFKLSHEEFASVRGNDLNQHRCYSTAKMSIDPNEGCKETIVWSMASPVRREKQRE